MSPSFVSSSVEMRSVCGVVLKVLAAADKWGAVEVR
jgi:hypothetical protein